MAGIARGSSIGLKLLVLLGIYFGLHVLTRSIVSNNLQLDEAEQLIVTQDWRWGYGSQPPLYNWIQKALFSALGVHVFPLSLLKNICLWCAYAFTFLAAREILASARLAALSTASLLFIPHIAWESQRDQSHLVLATTISAATLWIFMRLLNTRAPLWYILFGMAVGFGFLAKYNYLLLPASLVIACLLFPQFRRAVVDWKIVVAVLAFACVVGPHVVWMLENKTAVASQSYKFMATGMLVPASRFAGVLQVFKAFLEMAIAPLVVFSPFLFRKRTDTEGLPLLSLLARTFMVGVVLCLLLVVVTRVTYLRDRWVQPLMFAFPMLLVGIARNRISEVHGKRLFAFATVAAIAALTAINLTVLGANALKRSHNLNIPYPGLAEELRRAGFEHGTIIANGFSLGGNLKNQFRDCRVIVPELEENAPPQKPIIIVWSARSEERPTEFLQYASRFTAIATNLTPTYVDIAGKNGRRTSEKFGFVLAR